MGLFEGADAGGAGHANIDRILGELVAFWPSHAKFLRSSFRGYTDGDLMLIDDLARRVLLLAGENHAAFIASYKWLCNEMNKEALYFKKHGTYRLTSFADANVEVYSNADYMRRYMEGLLVSQVFWRNHSAAFLYFRDIFLPRLRPAFSYLEVGPGHGLFLSVAAEHASARSVEGWDVSAESLRQTQHALATMGVEAGVRLDRQDIHAPTRAPADGRYDGIAICEVLEHLEDPVDALRSLRRFLQPDGLMFINVPINSPAADHIFLLRTPDEVRALVQAAGLKVLELTAEPMTGYSLEAALSQQITVNCFVLAQ